MPRETTPCETARRPTGAEIFPIYSWGYTPGYIYLGSGTPSRLTVEQIIEIASTMRESFDVSRIEQHMMETSPDNLTAEKLEAMRSVGIGRLSMGGAVVRRCRTAQGHSISLRATRPKRPRG